MLGVMTAMPEEAEAIVAEAAGRAERIEHGRRTYYVGDLWGERTVVVVSRVGKVAAATTVTELLVRFNVRGLVFTGVAGALDHTLHPGDIVVADRLVQHDIDASPMFPPRVVPLLGIESFPTDAGWTDRLHTAADAYAASQDSPQTVRRGAIVSGDRFVKSLAEVESIRAGVPDALCVEMEGAAVAQVAYEYGVPLAVARIISDHADEAAPEVFLRSLAERAADASHGILERLLAPNGVPAR
jgi:adenosylhomocysteine nucleosidase